MKNLQPEKKGLIALTIIILAFISFLLFFFYQFSQEKPNPKPLTQPSNVEVSNTADFNQQNRLEASGASIIIP